MLGSVGEFDSAWSHPDHLQSGMSVLIQTDLYSVKEKRVRKSTANAKQIADVVTRKRTPGPRAGAVSSEDSGPSPRARLIATARRLFCQEGVRAVGIDRVLAESGVAKMTLYHYFPSKDQLIVACLEEHEREFLQLWETEAGAPGTAAGDKLRNLLRFVARRTSDPTYQGCFFLNTAHAFPEHDHPARVTSVTHKKSVAALIFQLCKDAKAKRPELLSRHLVLLMNGAQAIAGMLGRETQLAVITAGEALLAAEGI
jgi:AcrR family transcriptional regulator